jgi:uncharacterized damage-inducible protein DinB
MPTTMQEMMAAATRKTMEQLVEAYQRIPEEKRSWMPEAKGRSAADQVAECAMINGFVAESLQTHTFDNAHMGAFVQLKSETAALPEEALTAKLRESAEKVIAAIMNVKEDDLEVSIDFPWGTMKLPEVLIGPYWNMTYHLGQINYIASLLGCLE